MVEIIGVGSTKFDEHWNYGLQELISQAAFSALKSANLETTDIDTIFLANCLSSTINSQNNLNAFCYDELGIQNSVSIGGGDAAGAYAIIQAANSIMAKQSKTALVIGVEKMSDMPTSNIIKIISEIIEYEHEAITGATLAGLYAMITLRHMKLYGTSEEQLDMVSIKNHHNAVENDIAQFRFRITKEDVRKSSVVASPLRLLHCAAPSDGCCALVICNDDVAKGYKDKIKFIGTGVGSDYMSVHGREDITTFESLKSATRTAMNNSGITIKDVSFAELHDSFSIAEIISIEDIGIAKKGEGGKFIESGSANLDGKFPINPSGGLKGCGHPFGATGVRQAIESFYQLTNTANKRQVKDARYALSASLSGTASTAVVNIFGK